MEIIQIRLRGMPFFKNLIIWGKGNLHLTPSGKLTARGKLLFAIPDMVQTELIALRMACSSIHINEITYGDMVVLNRVLRMVIETLEKESGPQK